MFLLIIIHVLSFGLKNGLFSLFCISFFLSISCVLIRLEKWQKKRRKKKISHAKPDMETKLQAKIKEAYKQCFLYSGLRYFEWGVVHSGMGWKEHFRMLFWMLFLGFITAAANQNWEWQMTQSLGATRDRLVPKPSKLLPRAPTRPILFLSHISLWLILLLTSHFS